MSQLSPSGDYTAEATGMQCFYLKAITQVADRVLHTLQRYLPVEAVLTTSVWDFAPLSLHSARVGAELGCRGQGFSVITSKCALVKTSSIPLPRQVG